MYRKIADSKALIAIRNIKLSYRIRGRKPVLRIKGDLNLYGRGWIVNVPSHNIEHCVDGRGYGDVDRTPPSSTDRTVMTSTYNNRYGACTVYNPNPNCGGGAVRGDNVSAVVLVLEGVGLKA